MKSLEENMEDMLDIETSETDVKEKKLSNDVTEDREKDYEYTRAELYSCLLYTSPSPRDLSTSRMPSSA